MANDREILQCLQDALAFEPTLGESELAVRVREGVVTLSGRVRSQAERDTAVRLAIRTEGVRAVANSLTIHRAPELGDTDIASAAARALARDILIPPGAVTVVVEDGLVTLHGSVDWSYQKEAAQAAMRKLIGPRGVTNSIIVRPPVKVRDVERRIESAFKRNAEIDARRIDIKAEEGRVVLTGAVRSAAERAAAEQAAWETPGVRHVDDELTILD
jgi:osmotically-inducible protein OsmY